MPNKNNEVEELKKINEDSFHETWINSKYGEIKIHKILLDYIITKAQEDARAERDRVIINDVIKMSDCLESECNNDSLGDKGTEQWKAFKRFRNGLRDKYLTQDKQ